MSSSASSRPPPPPAAANPYELDITILSAKHLHNCNWRQGDLKPYVSLSIDSSSRRFTTKPDDAGSTHPIWNERFIVPINVPIHDSHLSVEINHSGDPSPKPIGSVQFPLRELFNSDDSKLIRTLQVIRPSGRPQGKIRVKVSLRERPSLPPPPPPQNQQDYNTTAHTPHQLYYYPPLYTPPPTPPSYPSPYNRGYTDPYSGYYPGYYSQIRPPPRPYYDQGPSYGGPSAPVDYSVYDQRVKGGNKLGVGVGTGLAVGAVAGALGGLALEEGVRHEEERIAERIEADLDGRDSYCDYRDYHPNY